VAGSALSGDFEMDLPEVGIRQAILDPQHLHANHAAPCIEVEDDARPHLLGLDDCGGHSRSESRPDWADSRAKSVVGKTGEPRR